MDGSQLLGRDGSCLPTDTDNESGARVMSSDELQLRFPSLSLDLCSAWAFRSAASLALTSRACCVNSIDRRL